MLLPKTQVTGTSQSQPVLLNQKHSGNFKYYIDIASAWKLRKSKTDVVVARTLKLCYFEVAILRFNGSMR